MQNYAPIVLFIYNRPEHTLKTLQALFNNTIAQESLLYVYADGPKNNATQNDLTLIKDTRNLIKSRNWCKEVIMIESNINKGLAPSIIHGVSEVIDKYDRAIVLEDDLVTSPYFLEYMNDGLNLYKNDISVASIHGYVYPVKKKLPEYFFIRGADCWGWATWKRAWNYFESDSSKLLNQIKQKKLDYLFNFSNTYNYTQMLQDQIDGKISSWAIRWYASTFLKNMYTLYPGVPFLENIGFDGSGTHCGSYKIEQLNLIHNYIPMKKISIYDNTKVRKQFIKYFSRDKKSFLVIFLKKIIRKLSQK